MTAARSVWLIIRTEGRTLVWDLGDLAGQALDDAITAARIGADFPADDAWASDPTSSCVSLTFGRPHYKLMATATERFAVNLGVVSAAEIADYRARQAEAAHRRQVDSTVDALSKLHPAALADVLAHPSLQAEAG